MKIINTIGRTIERFGKAMRVFSEAGDEPFSQAQSPPPPKWSSPRSGINMPDTWHSQSTPSFRNAYPHGTTWEPQQHLDERPAALHFEGNMSKDDDQEEDDQEATGRDPFDPSIDTRYLNLQDCQKDRAGQPNRITRSSSAPRPGVEACDKDDAGSDVRAAMLKVLRQETHSVFRTQSAAHNLSPNPYGWHTLRR
jgi:hypothetical protein